MEAGVLQQAQTALLDARSRKLRTAALDLLTQLAKRSETARTQMRGAAAEQAGGRVVRLLGNH